MSNFHYDLMAHLDATQKSGAIFTRAHYAIHQALRKANMRCRQFATVEELIAHVHGVSGIPTNELKEAA